MFKLQAYIQLYCDYVLCTVPSIPGD